MAEQEVIKHVKKTYKIWTSPDHSSWHKLKEFVVEIFIIVFAVTISIWFHDFSEHRHEQKEVQVFLLGLVNDLSHDITEMEGDKQSYLKAGAAFRFISSSKTNQPLSRDSLKFHANWIFNTTGLVPNNGRFEGFKSSGKIGNIEDEKLQNDILDLYQEDIPSLLNSSDAYSERKKDLFKFINQNLKTGDDKVSNLNLILTKDEGLNLSKSLSFPGEIISRYDICINKSKKIIAEIQKRYEE